MFYEANPWNMFFSIICNVFFQVVNRFFHVFCLLLCSIYYYVISNEWRFRCFCSWWDHELFLDCWHTIDSYRKKSNGIKSQLLGGQARSVEGLIMRLSNLALCAKYRLFHELCGLSSRFVRVRCQLSPVPQIVDQKSSFICPVSLSIECCHIRTNQYFKICVRDEPPSIKHAEDTIAVASSQNLEISLS